VSVGFANPAIINARKPYICGGTDPSLPPPTGGYHCNNTLTGAVTTERMSRTPDERLYSSGDNSSFAFTQCYVLWDPDGADFAFTKCDSKGSSPFPVFPRGTGESPSSTSGTTCWSMACRRRSGSAARYHQSG